MMRANAIDVRFIPEEDRLGLALRSPDETIELMITRRMTRGMLAAIVELLMRSSPEVAAAPGESRNDVLMFEHMEAAAGWQRNEFPPPEPRGAADTSDEVRQTDAGPNLLAKLDVTLSQNKILLQLHDADQLRGTIDLTRDNAHQFLSIVREKTVQAQWDINELAWMDRRTQFVVPTGVRPC